MSWFHLTSKQRAEAKSCHPITYCIGWEIYLTDGSRLSRNYENVEESEAEKTKKLVESEVANMHLQLEDATEENATFVNLGGAVIRLADVKRVCVYFNNKKP